MLSILAEVFQDFGVVHVVWVVSRDGKVTIAHHLLGDVDSQGTVDAGSVWLRHFLWTPFKYNSQMSSHKYTIQKITKAFCLENLYINL